MNTQLPIMTVCYPWRRTVRHDGSHLDEILIGTHKDTKGARKIRMVDKDNGPGGKFEPEKDPTVEHCAQREVGEEMGITPTLEKIIRAGVFHVKNEDGFEGDLHFFFADSWTGEPATETDIFKNIRWCNINNLPYENMMDADRVFWLPLLMFSAMERGKIVMGTLRHDKDMKVIPPTPKFTYIRR
jgi:8-oxo-dGTP pyrophosphatase MutT (NUDIX family)